MSKRRNGFRCFECDNTADHAHHVVPHSLGGTRTLPLCIPCHNLVHSTKTHQDHAKLTKEGIARARANGGKHGRQRIPIDSEFVKVLRAEGFYWFEIAAFLGINKRTFESRVALGEFK